MLQQYVVLREAILGKNRCTRNVSWMLCHYLQKEEENEMMILISSENKVPNYEVDDAGHHKILFTQKLQSFSSGTGTLLSGLVCNIP